MPPSPPQDDQKRKRAEVERLLKQRQKQTEEERAQAEARESQIKEHWKEEQEAFLGETRAARGRGEEREAWRKGQHKKQEEEQESRWKKERERNELEEQKHKAEAEEKLRHEHLEDLHRTAVVKKLATKQEAIEREERREQQYALESAARRLKEIDEEEKHALEQLLRDARRKTTERESFAEKQHGLMKDKRALLLLGGQLEEDLAKIEAERTHGGEEIRRVAAEKRQRALHQKQTRTKEAEDRRQSAEKWLEGFD